MTFARAASAFAESVPEEFRALLFDPQTSGGLLVSIAPDSADCAMAALKRFNVSAQAIGEIIPRTLSADRNHLTRFNRVHFSSFETLMDPITHGITGALLGKGYFSERKGPVAVFAATLGAVFPDIDIIAEIGSRDPLAIIKYHRGITHSFVGLPFFAALLAWLTHWVARRRGIEAPSWAMLTLIYGVGIASHILLDGMTSFGTRMWTPISQKRVAWDFCSSSISVLPLSFCCRRLQHGFITSATRKAERAL